METLGTLIKAARKQRGITSLDLALQIGVTQATISRLENDDYAQAPKPEITRGLATVLGIPEVEMLKAAGYRIVDVDSKPYDAVSAQIARTVTRWTPERRVWLLTLMEATDAMLGAAVPDNDDTDATA